MRHASLVAGSRPEASLALAAVREALAARTASSGSASITNADGSRTIIGAGGVELGTTADLRWLTASGSFTLRSMRMQLSRAQQTLADGGVVSNTSRMNQISVDPPPISTTGYPEGSFWTQVESATSLVAKAIWRAEAGAWVQKDLGASTLIAPTMDAGLIDAAAVAAKMIVSGEMWSDTANPRHGMTSAGFRSFDGMARETVHLDGQRNTLRGTSDFGRVVLKRFTAPEGIQIKDLGWPSWSSVTARDFSGLAKSTTNHAVKAYYGVLPESMTWDTAPESFSDLDFTFDPNGDYSSVPEYVGGRWSAEQLRAYAAAAIWVDDTHGTSALFRDLNGLGYLAPEPAMGVVPAMAFQDDGSIEARQDDPVLDRRFRVTLSPTRAGIERRRTVLDGTVQHNAARLEIGDGGVLARTDGWTPARPHGDTPGRYDFGWMRNDLRVEPGRALMQHTRTDEWVTYNPDGSVAPPTTPAIGDWTRLEQIDIRGDGVKLGIDGQNDQGVSAYVRAEGGYVNSVGVLRTSWAANSTFIIKTAKFTMKKNVVRFTWTWWMPEANSVWNAVFLPTTMSASRVRFFIIDRTRTTVVIRAYRDYAADSIDVGMVGLIFQNPLGE